MEHKNILLQPEKLFYRVRAQSAHGGGTNATLSLTIPIQQSNIIKEKFFNKLVRVVVEQLDIRAMTVGPADPFDGLNFVMSNGQTYGQVNAYTNTYNIQPDRSLIFLGKGEIANLADAGGNLTYRTNSYEEGVVVYMDGTPLTLQVADWSGTPYTTAVACGLDSVSCWWSIILRIHPMEEDSF